MSGQERYEYRPEDGGRAPYGADAPGRSADGNRRRGPAEQTGPDADGPGGYDPLGIRRSPADLPGVTDPPRVGDPRGGDSYGGYGRDGYPDQSRGGRGYQEDPYGPPGGYDRDPYPRGRDERPAPDDRIDHGRDPYGRDWGTPENRGGYPVGRDSRDPQDPYDRDPYGRGHDDRADQGGYPVGRDSREERVPGGYPDLDRDSRDPHDPYDRDPYGRGHDDRGHDDRADRGGYPTGRDSRTPGGYPDPRGDLDRESDTHRRSRRDAEYGYGADPLGMDASAPPPPSIDRVTQSRGGNPRHTTDPRHARPGADPRLSDPRLNDPRLGNPELIDPRHSGTRGGHVDPRDAVLDDPRAGAGRGAGWDRDRAPTGSTVWEAIVEAEREYYDSGDDHRVPFPTFYPRRVFALAGSQMLVGRRSESRGIHPDIDLSGAPEDPGISRSHALFELLPDGGYAVRDPGSTNGTRLNDEPDPIEPGQPVPLRDGDRVYLGAWTRITLRAR
ncbi:FHA domain-containing protein [Frankia sp. CcWB3]